MNLTSATQTDEGWHLPSTAQDSTSFRNEKIDLRGIGPFREANFFRLVEHWRNATMFMSSTAEMKSLPEFAQIVQMGESVVPWIIREIRVKRDFLYLALPEILGINPVLPSDRGNPKKMIEAWIIWADRELPTEKNEF